NALNEGCSVRFWQGIWSDAKRNNVANIFRKPRFEVNSGGFLIGPKRKETCHRIPHIFLL
ncbi:MAG TPA: hypothetical protein VEM15_10025, partial [Thermodesulfobacteriota bacterium]|nr:hypothetical protein [Thermodesulfobacteriota bacterium]